MISPRAQPPPSEQADAIPSASRRIGNASVTSIDARDDRVGGAAVVAGDHAEQHADRHGEGRGDERHLERDARAEEDAREDVLADGIDTEEEVPGRAGRGSEDRVERGRVLRVGRMRERPDDQRRRQRDDDLEDDEPQRDERDAFLPEALPEELPGSPRGDLRGLGWGPRAPADCLSRAHVHRLPRTVCRSDRARR